MKKTIYEKVFELLESHKDGLWGGEIERKIPLHKGCTVARRLRELAKGKSIICEKRQVDGKGAWCTYYYAK